MKSIVVLSVLAVMSVALARSPGEGKYPLFEREEPASFRDSAHHFDVRHYLIDLNLPMTSGAMSARCRVEMIPRHDNLDTFSLHFVDLVCDSIRRDGNVCTFTTGSGRLLVDLDRPFANGESLAVDIYYHRTAGTQNRGFYWYAKGTQSIPHAVVYSVTETDDSRYWFPCFDQPWDKAERGCRINVTVPDSLEACANGTLDSVTADAGAHTETYWWTHRYPISTYLMCFAASRFANWRIWHVRGGDSMPVRYYVWPEDSSRAVGNFSRMDDMLQFFSQPDIYDDYPFFSEKYGMVAVYPYPWGGMEHQTMTTIHRSWATNGSVSGIAHELAHMWWGDMVTCLDWRNIWLNEGFATYSDELYTDHYLGRSAFLSVIRDRADYYFTEESRDPHPIYDPEPGHEFDYGHSYCKGAWVQHMLRYVVGDTVWSSPGLFFSILRAYGDSLRFGNANTDDYQRITEQITGTDLGWFFNEWVHSLGYPSYSVGWQGRQTVDGWEVVVDLAQDNMSGAPPVFHMPVEVRVNLASGGSTVRLDVSANPQRFVFPVAGQPTGLVFDPNEWVLDSHIVTVGVAQSPDGRPRRTTLSVAGPNPGSGLPRLAFELASPGPIRLAIYDASGRLARTLAVGSRAAGRHEVLWDRRCDDGRKAADGLYVARLTTRNGQFARRLTLLDWR